MRNKDFLRRAAAFAVSLSFVSYSGMVDISNFEAADSEKVTTSTGKASVTTPVTSVAQTSEVTTAPVTSITTTTAVTTESINYISFDLEVDKKIDQDQAKLIVKSIFGSESKDSEISRTETQNSVNFSIKIKETSENKDKTLNDYITKNTNIKSIKKTNSETEKYIVVDDQCYYISGVKEKKIKLELCLYLNINDTNVTYDESSGEVTINDKFKIGTVMQFSLQTNGRDGTPDKQFCVRARNTIKCSGVKGWNIKEADSNITLDISPEDNVDHYINLQYNNNKVTFSEEKMIYTDNNIQRVTVNNRELNLEESTFELNVSGILADKDNLTIRDSNGKDISKSHNITWNSAKYIDLKILAGYTYSVDVYRKSNETDNINVVKDCKDEYRINFTNDNTVNKYLYMNDVVVKIVVRPAKLPLDILWDDSVGNNITSQEFTVENGRVSIPYLERHGKDSYYLDRIELENKNIIINKSSLIYTIKEGKNLSENISIGENKVKRIVYKKIGKSDKDISELRCYTSFTRNKDCQSIEPIKSGTQIKLFRSESNKYFKYNYFFNRHYYKDEWYKLNADNDFEVYYDYKFIQITSIFNIDEKEETISEIKLDAPLNIYYDDSIPVVSNVTISPEIKKHAKKVEDREEYWSNGTYDFSVCISDVDKDFKNFEGIDKIVNTPSENFSEIKSVNIGGYTFINNNGNWEKEEDYINSEYTVSISSVEYNESKRGFDFNISVALNEGVDIFNNNISVIATDICDNESDPVSVKILIDKTAPVLNSMNVQNISENAQKAMAVRTITQGSDKTARVDVSADLDDPEYERYVTIQSNDITDTTISEEGSVIGTSISRVKSIVSGSGIKNIKTEYITDTGKSISSECTETNSYTAHLDGSQIDAVKNSNGKIKITAEDYAGNISIYYYKAGTSYSVVEIANNPLEIVNNVVEIANNASEIADNASKVIFDILNPECEISLPDADYIENKNKNNEKNWYKAYPSLPIKASDPLSNICSGLKTLSFSINDQKASVDIAKYGISTDELSSGKYSVKFSLNKGVISAALTNGTLSVPLIADMTPDPKNRYKVTLSISDYSDNISDLASQTFYIDMTSPEVSETYIIGNKETEHKVTQTKYGDFSNEKVKIDVEVTDEKNSSGLSRSAILTYPVDSGTKYESTNCIQDGNHCIYSFTVPKDEIGNDTVLTGKIGITVTDNVGNKTDVKTLKSVKGSDTLTIERKVPEIAVSMSDGGNKYFDETSRNTWYSGDVTVSYKVNDEDSGINKTRRTVRYDKGEDEITEDYSIAENVTKECEYTLSTRDGEDGEFIFDLHVIDNSGNINDADTISVFKDITSPEISGFKYKSGIVKQWEDFKNGDTAFTPFGFFNNTDSILTVYAKDDNASSGVRSIYVILTNSDGTLYGEYEQAVSNKDKDYDEYYSKDFIVPEGFKGTIEAYAVDNVNNESEKKSPYGHISENAERHSKTSDLTIKLPPTEYNDISQDKLPLYSDDIMSEIVAKDTHSGISKIEWNTSDFGKEEWHSIEVDKDGNIHGDNVSDWEIISTERNIVTEIKGKIKVSTNKNDDHVIVKITDNSGNNNQKEEHFSIDKTVPSIDLKWDNKTDNNYYNADRKASVYIKERNFNGADIKINDSSKSLDFKLVSGAETEGTDNAVYCAEYTFSSDGEFELSADCTDMCSNKAQNVKSEKFIVDKTRPVLNVSFTDVSGKPVDASNSRYYSSAVNAVVTVTEVNFNKDLISVGINGEKKNDCTWRDNGNVHTTVVPFSTDGDYRLTIDGKDIAGNKFDGYNYDFCIDMVTPSIDFGKVYDAQSGTVTEGMRPADNSSQIAPVIVISDNNLNPDNITITLESSIHNEDIVLVSKGNEKNDEYLDTSECYYDSKSGKYVISLYNISADDIYDITVDAYDMSGNKGSVGSGKSQYLDKTSSGIKFSVNRNGSTFELTEDTASNINKKYLKQPKNVSIREVNVNEHSENPDILIHKDIENQADPYVNFTENNSGGFVEYIYDLPESNFEDLAKYSVDILSSDIAGNKNSSSAVKENNSEDFLSFWVDSEAPDCSLLNIQSGKEYSEAQMQCRVQITDNIEVDEGSIRIMLDGREVDYKLIDTNVYGFNIDASNKERTIQVNCCDMAQNTINRTVAENFMVSKNPFVIFFHKKIVKMLTAIIGGIAVVSGAAITIFRKKRRIK